MEEKFGVVVAIGLTFFGLMLIASEDMGLSLDFGGGEERDQVEMLSVNPGNVGEANSDIRTARLGTFNVGEGRGDIQVLREDRPKVSNALFSENPIEFSYNATQPEHANISFEVLGKEGSGALYIEANGERIFEEQLVTSGDENVRISSENLVPGVNEFKIGTTKGGLFSSAEYALEDFRATVNDRKFSDYRDSFQMYDYELQDYGFVGANLTFNIPADSAVATEPLQIHVNGNEIFNARSVRSDQSIEIPRGEADLHPGYNTISFETESDATYSIENAQITVRYIGQTAPTVEEYSFNLDEEDLSFVEREDTMEEISYNYQIVSGDRELYFELGEFNTTVEPVNGENTVEVPEDAFSSSNTLEIRSSGSFNMNDLRIFSEVNEDG
jgi:hypothetical protein